MEMPIYYDWKNALTSRVSPSTIHAENTALSKFFAKYLLQKAISVFAWEIPETWDKYYLLYGLYTNGYIAIIKTDKYGVIPQLCTLKGYNIYYEPTQAVITNPLLKGIIQPKIDEQCAIIKLNHDFSGICDIVNYYANLLALASESLHMNFNNSKFAYCFGAENPAQAETMKKMYDEISAGNPAVFTDKNLFREDGSPKWLNFVNNLQQNYIADSIITDIKRIEAMFDTEIGIPNSNTDKKERLIVQEVTSNNVETASKCELWLESINSGITSAKKIFGNALEKFTVKWRVDPVEQGGMYDGHGSGNIYTTQWATQKPTFGG